MIFSWIRISFNNFFEKESEIVLRRRERNNLSSMGVGINVLNPPPPPPTPILLFHFIMVPTSSEFMGYYWVTFSEKQEVDDVKGLSLWAIRLWLFKLIRIVPINYPSGEFFVKNTDWKLAGPEKLSTISSKKDRKSSNVEGNGASWAVWELGCEHIFQKRAQFFRQPFSK